MSDISNQDVEQAIETIQKAKEISEETHNYDHMFTLDEAEAILSVWFKE